MAACATAWPSHLGVLRVLLLPNGFATGRRSQPAALPPALARPGAPGSRPVSPPHDPPHPQQQYLHSAASTGLCGHLHQRVQRRGRDNRILRLHRAPRRVHTGVLRRADNKQAYHTTEQQKQHHNQPSGDLATLGPLTCLGRSDLSGAILWPGPGRRAYSAGRSRALWCGVPPPLQLPACTPDVLLYSSRGRRGPSLSEPDRWTSCLHATAPARLLQGCGTSRDLPQVAHRAPACVPASKRCRATRRALLLRASYVLC